MSDHELPPLTPPGGLVPPGGPAPAPASAYYPPRPPYPGQAPYLAPARPPAEPSTGAGWTIVAILSWWPFGIAAYLHSQRAIAALGAGDRRQAEREGARARRIGIGGLVSVIVLATVVAVGTMFGMFGMYALALWAGSTLDAAQTESATSHTPEDEPGSGPADGTSVWELSEGDCYLTDGLTEVVRTVAVVPCDEPHGGELYDLYYVPGYAFDERDELDRPLYPGDAEMGRYADDVCRTALEELTGTSAAESGLSYWYTAPDAWDWRTMDRRIRCLAESATPLSGTVGDR